MNRTDAVWGVGRLTIGTTVTLLTRLRVYGAERVPARGGLVVASNHFSWIDPPVLGAASPRTLYYMAKVEAHRVPGLGQLMRSFGAFPVRRGESDRDGAGYLTELRLGRRSGGPRAVPSHLGGVASRGRPRACTSTSHSQSSRSLRSISTDASL